MPRKLPVLTLVWRIGLGLVLVTPSAGLAQENQETSAWQLEKCRLYGRAWTQALDAFGSDDLNFNFMAQNENFLAGGCLDATAICPRSTQELQIADALTMAMMNAGAASTFLPFRCAPDAPAAMPPGGLAADAQLCRSQLELLLAGDKLTAAETQMFEAQCACLEGQAETGRASDCAN